MLQMLPLGQEETAIKFLKLIKAISDIKFLLANCAGDCKIFTIKNAIFINRLNQCELQLTERLRSGKISLRIFLRHSSIINNLLPMFTTRSYSIEVNK